MSITLAVDPGQSGAFAWVNSVGELVDIADMPVIEVRGKRRISAAGVADLMRRHPVTRVVIEAVVAMPRRGPDGSVVGMGSASTGSFFYGAGVLEGCAAALDLPVEIIMPGVWKRRAAVSKDKGVARQMAQRTWPAHAQRFARVKDDGRAESALLARWAVMGTDSRSMAVA